MEVTPAAHAAALWTGAHLLLLLVLSLLVVRQRNRSGVMLGHGDVPALEQASRAFGNAAEYIPAGLVGLGVMAVVGAPMIAVHTCGLLLFLGRVAHAIGLSRAGGPSRLRSVGMTLTWAAYILEAVALLIFAPG
ncbi:MAG TPA: MAPEG family protein [Caulobacteraceae bacterium]